MKEQNLSDSSSFDTSRRTIGGFFTGSRTVFEDLECPDTCVMLKLVIWADYRTRVVHTSQTELAKLTKIPRGTVQIALKRLMNKGLIILADGIPKKDGIKLIVDKSALAPVHLVTWHKDSIAPGIAPGIAQHENEAVNKEQVQPQEESAGIGSGIGSGINLALNDPGISIKNKEQRKKEEEKRSPSVPDAPPESIAVSLFDQPALVAIGNPKPKPKPETKTALVGKTEKEKTDGSKVWDAYRDAYLARYKVEPLRDKMANKWMKNVVEALGVEDGRSVAEFYVKHNNSFYVAKSHAPKWFADNVSSLRTEWLRNRPVTSIQARQTEKISQNQTNAERALADYERRKAEERKAQ